MDISLIEPWLKVASPVLVAIFGWVGKKLFSDRAKLVHFLVHAAAHPLPQNVSPSNVGSTQVQQLSAQPLQNVNTHSFVIRNIGNRTANNVRIGHAWLPRSFRIYPELAHRVEGMAEGPAEIVLPTLVPNEQVTISYLYWPPVMWNQVGAYVKSDEGMARGVNVIPTVPYPPVLRYTMIALFLVGASTTVYWVLRALQIYLVQA